MSNDDENQYARPSIEEVSEAVGRLGERVDGIDTNMASLRQGISQDLRHLREAVTPLSSVLTPKPPPQKVVRAMQAITNGLGPELVLEAMKVPDFPIPFIGDPSSYDDDQGVALVQAQPQPLTPPEQP